MCTLQCWACDNSVDIGIEHRLNVGLLLLRVSPRCSLLWDDISTGPETGALTGLWSQVRRIHRISPWGRAKRRLWCQRLGWNLDFASRISSVWCWARDKNAEIPPLLAFLTFPTAQFQFSECTRTGRNHLIKIPKSNPEQGFPDEALMKYYIQRTRSSKCVSCAITRNNRSPFCSIFSASSPQFIWSSETFPEFFSFFF